MDSRELKNAKRDLVENVLPTLKTGDIILTSSGSLIVQFMSKFQSDPVRWGHVLVAKDKDKAWEAHWTLRNYSLSKFFKNKLYWKIARKKDLNDEQRDAMKRVAPPLMGKMYGFWRIALQLLDHIFRTNKFSKSNENVELQVCSSFAAWLFDEATGYKFNDVEWMSCDPDDIEDDFEKFPERWEILEERLENV